VFNKYLFINQNKSMATTIKNQPDKEEFKRRLENVGKTQADFAKAHRCRPQQITQALNGTQPGLMNRMLRHLEKLEALKAESSNEAA
jgi:hypothetical protein